MFETLVEIVIDLTELNPLDRLAGSAGCFVYRNLLQGTVCLEFALGAWFELVEVLRVFVAVLLRTHFIIARLNCGLNEITADVVAVLGGALLLRNHQIKGVSLLVAQILVLLAQHFADLRAAHGLHAEVAQMRVHYIILRFLLI